MVFVKGYSQSDEHKKKISLSNKGRFLGVRRSPETEVKKGSHLSKETEFKKGMIPWNKGKKGLQTGWSKGGVNLKIRGDRNHNWRGDKVGYENLHKWVRKMLGIPTYCSNNRNHIAKRFVWSNISGEYKRDISDWQQLCNSCNLKDGIKKHTRFKAGGN